MSQLRDFWVNVVGLDTPNGGLMIQEMQSGQRVGDDDAAAEFAADTLKAQVVQRLESLVKPFEQALMNPSADAERLQQQFMAIGNNIEDEQFEQAAADLDQLERLLDQQDTQANATPRFEIPVAPRLQPVTNGADRTKLGLGPGDIIPVVKDLLGPLSATCKITNNTEHTLILDPASLREDPTSGEFKQPPPPEIAKGQAEWIAVNKSTLGLHLAGVEFKVRYFIDEQRTAWEMHFVNPRVGDNSSDAQVIGPSAASFRTAASNGQGEDAVFLFTLDPQDGPRTQPPGPQPEQETDTSCLITINNDTQVELRLTGQSNERGDFMSLPPAAVAPGSSVSFAYVETPKETEPEKRGCKGSVTWDVGSPASAVWTCAWENLVAEKNTAQASLVPPGGLQSLAQIGQGDENVPVSFTISDGGAETVPPVVDLPPEVPPETPPDENEPDFLPPDRETEPTLRLGDKSKDGWVEYAQDLLGLAQTGNFDTAMRTAVRAFQKNNGIQVDGIIGFQTWAQLRNTPAKPPSTDGRPPHTFEDLGPKARWIIQEHPALYDAALDELTLGVSSVGNAQIEGGLVTVRITRPGKTTTVNATIGPPADTKPTDEGVRHFVALANFKARFPSEPPGADVTEYFVEAYLDKSLGGDFWKGNVQQL